MAIITSDAVVIGNGDVMPFDDAVIDPGNNFDLALSAFVAPVDGYYQ